MDHQTALGNEVMFAPGAPSSAGTTNAAPASRTAAVADDTDRAARA
ncbi:hypothetical protein [Streptomyces sp. NBC_01637]